MVKHVAGAVAGSAAIGVVAGLLGMIILAYTPLAYVFVPINQSLWFWGCAFAVVGVAISLPSMLRDKQ